MAKLQTVGGAAVVVSEVKLETLKTVKKYRPDMLNLKDEEKNVIYKVTVGEGMGSLGKYGAEFGETVTSEGYATITIAPSPTKVEELVDKYGFAILNLNKIEEAVLGCLDEIEAEKATIESCITVG